MNKLSKSQAKSVWDDAICAHVEKCIRSHGQLLGALKRTLEANDNMNPADGGLELEDAFASAKVIIAKWESTT